MEALTAHHNNSEGICPNCGKWGVLTDREGWCLECSPNSVQCPCGRVFPSDGTHSKCPKCRYHERDERDRVRLTELRSQGVTRKAARKIIQQERQKHCIVCGRELKYKPENALFCTQTKNCRRYRQRYFRANDKQEALEKIRSELRTSSNQENLHIL